MTGMRFFLLWSRFCWYGVSLCRLDLCQKIQCEPTSHFNCHCMGILIFSCSEPTQYLSNNEFQSILSTRFPIRKYAIQMLLVRVMRNSEFENAQSSNSCVLLSFKSLLIHSWDTHTEGEREREPNHFWHIFRTRKTSIGSQIYINFAWISRHWIFGIFNFSQPPNWQSSSYLRLYLMACVCIYLFSFCVRARVFLI